MYSCPSLAPSGEVIPWLVGTARIWTPLSHSWASLVAQMVKNPPAMQETRVWSLGREDSLKKGMAAHSSILAWRIPWTEEPGGLQSMGPQTVGHCWPTNTFCFWSLDLYQLLLEEWVRVEWCEDTFMFRWSIPPLESLSILSPSPGPTTHLVILILFPVSAGIWCVTSMSIKHQARASIQVGTLSIRGFRSLGQRSLSDPFSLCTAKKQKQVKKSVFDEELTNTSKKALKQYRAG